MFEDCQPLVVSYLDGYNVCLMAYGQTGSGKTHTLHGTTEDPGITPRAAQELFRLMEERQEEYTVQLSMSILEIYNNDIYDLMQDRARCDLQSSDAGVPPLYIFLFLPSFGSPFVF